MSVLSNESRTTTSFVLPRVNLLPPEIAVRRRFRQIQMGLGAAVLACLGLVFLLYLVAMSSVSSANEQRNEADARHAKLQRETLVYRDVTAIRLRADAAAAMLTSAMGQEVRYSQLMNDLSLSVPENVWFKNLNFTQAAPAPVLGVDEPGIGTMTVTAIAFSHDDVAVWLESLASQKTFANPDFTTSTEALLGTRKTVNFTSTAAVTSAALSKRYTAPAGG